MSLCTHVINRELLDQVIMKCDVGKLLGNRSAISVFVKAGQSQRKLDLYAKF